MTQNERFECGTAHTSRPRVAALFADQGPFWYTARRLAKERYGRLYCCKHELMERAEYLVMAVVESYHWWYGGMRATAAAMLDMVYAGRRDLQILDAGCGSGGNALFLERYGSVVGIDLAPEALALSGSWLAGALARASVLAVPFAEARFDLVTSFDVLYHRAVPDEQAALSEARRVLKPGGRLLIRVPAYDFLRRKHDRVVHTRRRYTAGAVQALLRSTGYSIERCTYVNSLLLPLALTQRLIEWALPHLERDDSDLAMPFPQLNEILRWPLAAEAAWLRHGRAFPCGMSVLCLARKCD
jgi:SAM-dependent methyltransferase